jgi:formate dehydrogenase-N gamma subunit
VALSGIVLFPDAAVADETFGTPQMGRILHPFFGVLISCADVYVCALCPPQHSGQAGYPVAEGHCEVLKGEQSGARRQ